MPPLLQEDIRQYYEQTWKSSDASAKDETGLVYSSPIEDAVLYPLYQQLLEDLKISVNGGNVLDVGSGSGRWVRYFLERFLPASILGIDFTHGSIDLLNRRYASGPVACEFRIADLTQPELDLGRKFDLINVMNVLFHIPEPDRFMHAMRNLAAHLRRVDGSLPPSTCHARRCAPTGCWSAADTILRRPLRPLACG